MHDNKLAHFDSRDLECSTQIKAQAQWFWNNDWRAFQHAKEHTLTSRGAFVSHKILWCACAIKFGKITFCINCTSLKLKISILSDRNATSRSSMIWSEWWPTTHWERCNYSPQCECLSLLHLRHDLPHGVLFDPKKRGKYMAVQNKKQQQQKEQNETKRNETKQNKINLSMFYCPKNWMNGWDFGMIWIVVETTAIKHIDFRFCLTSERSRSFPCLNSRRVFSFTDENRCPYKRRIVQLFPDFHRSV